MLFSNKISHAGEHQLSLPGKVGTLEAILTIPELTQSTTLALIGHPHSLQGGTMNNKVVTTMARAFKELGIISLRFNFRGVGLSEGHYDEGIGESEDMLELARLWQAELGPTKFIFGGFSFGSFVAYRASAQMPNSSLITIAPPVHHFNYRIFNKEPRPWVIVLGESDELVLKSSVIEFAEKFAPPLPLIIIDTGHFFHGKLVELKTKLLHEIKSRIIV